MKKLFAFAFLASALMTSCADDFKYKSEEPGFGTLSFADLQISVDDSENIVRATEASGTYLITVKNAEGAVYGTYTYSNIKAEGISLPAGVYSLEVLSAESVPAAEFEEPVYGAQVENITITAGQKTPVGTITCTLQQCKVTVGYNDDFLAMVKGNCTTTVSIGESLDYNIVWDSTNSKISKYEQSAGYFNVNNGENTTMTVKFSGAIYDEESETTKVMRMTKTFTDIAAKQWRQVKFIKKINQEGNATFDIVLDEYVEDNPLNEDLTGSEESIGTDPNAPKGDGGIKLICTEGPAAEVITSWNEAAQTEKPVIDLSVDQNISTLKFTAEIPNGVYEFYVDITSTNSDFNTAVKGITVNKDGRIYLTKTEEEHRKVIDGLNLLGIAFPYPENVINKAEILFDLTKAIPALQMYSGTHTFAMYVTDTTGCKHQDESGKTKPINLTVVIE
ncbi:MAG: DUF4493 domain-containing protein [Alistipes sp.]|nr:DUF4493 domain-containing protein [Alistipes sp.]